MPQSIKPVVLTPSTHLIPPHQSKVPPKIPPRTRITLPFGKPVLTAEQQVEAENHKKIQAALDEKRVTHLSAAGQHTENTQRESIIIIQDQGSFWSRCCVFFTPSCCTSKNDAYESLKEESSINSSHSPRA